MLNLLYNENNMIGRLYIEAESNNFYKEIMQSNADDSQISSGLNLIDGIISFFGIRIQQSQ